MDYFIKRRPDDSPGSVWRLESGSTQQRWDWASGKWVADFDMVRLMGDGALDPVSQQEAEAAIASRSKGVRESAIAYGPGDPVYEYDERFYAQTGLATIHDWVDPLAEHGSKFLASGAPNPTYTRYHPGRGAREAPPGYVPSQAVVDALTEVKRLEDHERLIVIGPDGEVRLRKDGTKSHVSVGGNLDPLLKDAIFVHNHPSGLPPSDGDFELAVLDDAAGFYAIGSDEWGKGWVYHVLRPAGGWPMAPEPSGVREPGRYVRGNRPERARRFRALTEALAAIQPLGNAVYDRELFGTGFSNITDWAERARYATMLSMHADRTELARLLGAGYVRSSWTP